MVTSRLLAFAATWMVIAFARPSWAEQDVEDRARELFFEGHRAADAGDHETACAKFAKSLELFRRGSTLLNLGKCHRELGKTATALRHYEEAAALLEPSDTRMDEAQARMQELRLEVPTVIIQLPDPLPSTAVVTLDGEPMAARRLREPLRLDPGEHVFRVTATEHEPMEQSFTLQKRDRRELTLALGPSTRPLAPIEPEPSIAVLPARPSPSATPPVSEEAHQVPLWSWLVGAGGLVVAGASIPFFVDYENTVQHQLDRCRGSLVACDPEPKGSYDPNDDNARRDRDLVAGTVLAIVGGSALVSAAVGAIIGEQNPRSSAITPRGLRLSF